MPVTHHPGTISGRYARHLATWRIGSVDERPEPPLTIGEVIELLYAARNNPRFPEYILMYVTGIFEGNYPQHEAAEGEPITLSYLWHNVKNRTGAVGQAQEISRKYNPISVPYELPNDGAREWVNYRANFDGHNWLEVWQIEIADY